jgi:hypothetical protein
VETDQTQLLIEFLRERDTACPRCAYNLRNATQPRCSECGLPIVLSVRPSIAVTTHWIAAITIYGSSALIGVFFLCLVLRLGWPGHPRLISPPNLALMAYMLHIPLPIFLLKSRRRFIRLSTAAQKSVWIVGAVLATAMLASLIIFVR